MNYTLGERHLSLAGQTETNESMHVSTLERSIARTWTRPMEDYSRDYCDFLSAISGDDLARIAAFEPKREPTLWADVRKGNLHVRPAA